MMQRTIRRLAGYTGTDMKYLYPNGVPKRQFPFREMAKHVGMAPSAGGFYFTQHAVGMPFIPPFQFLFPRAFITVFFATILSDMYFGFSPIIQPFLKEAIPGRPSHFFFNNNGGMPHHFWQFQDGWTIRNESGARRWME